MMSKLNRKKWRTQRWAGADANGNGDILVAEPGMATEMSLFRLQQEDEEVTHVGRCNRIGRDVSPRRPSAKPNTLRLMKKLETINTLSGQLGEPAYLCLIR